MGNLKSAHNHMTPGIFGKSLVWRHTAEPAARKEPLGVDQKQSPNIAMKDVRTVGLSYCLFPTPGQLDS